MSSITERSNFANAATDPSTPSAKRTPKPLPTSNNDFYQHIDVLTADEKVIIGKVRTYMETKVRPIINRYWADDAFPFELLPSSKEL
jgi:hypothetical protein